MKDKKDVLPVICCEEQSLQRSCCPAADQNSPATDYAWQNGQVDTPAGSVPLVTTALEWRDIIGGWKARWGLGRMNYRIPPGLYAVGDPGPNSPVLVSANYKLSFDSLRRELTGLNLWLMIIDTNGINVWCAAGKGTFGTAELVERIEKVCLKDIVKHRKIIVPQLAAPGVAAHTVLKRSGFQVVYGPVRARDIPAFLKRGCVTTPQMRQVSFTLRERLQVVPVELALMSKFILWIFLVLLGLNVLTMVLNGTFSGTAKLLSQTMADIVPILGAVLLGTVLVPLLLPYIPGRAFALKGFIVGFLWALVYILLVAPPGGWMPVVAYLLLLPSISAFLSVNFTGSSTYTSLSGVVKEMSIALPLIVMATTLGILGLVVGRFL